MWALARALPDRFLRRRDAERFRRANQSTHHQLVPSRRSDKLIAKAEALRPYMRNGHARQQRGDRVLRAVKRRDREAILCARAYRPSWLRIPEMRHGRTVHNYSVHRLPG